MKNKLYKLFMLVFSVSLPMFLILGVIIVFGQIIGLIINSGTIVLTVNELLKTIAIKISSICAFSGFFIGYLKDKK